MERAHRDDARNGYAMELSSDSIDWPARELPGVVTASMFPLDDRGFGHAYRTPTHAVHLHDYVGTIRLRDRDFSLTPGTLTLSPAGEDSSYDLSRPGTHWCVHFDPATSSDGPLIRLPLVVTLGARAPEAAARFARVARLHQLAQRAGSHPASAIAASVAMAELLHWVGLLDLTTDASTFNRDAVVERIVEYVDRNLPFAHNAQRLAETVGLSQNYLARLFHRHTGMTVARYKLSRRVEHAKLLLRSSLLPVKQIAIRIGLPDAQQFNKQFRSITGMSPSAYRREES